MYMETHIFPFASGSNMAQHRTAVSVFIKNFILCSSWNFALLILKKSCIHDFTPTRVAITEKIMNIGKNIEKLKPSYIYFWWECNMRDSLAVPQKVKLRVNI